jgi:hypothetical protein
MMERRVDGCAVDLITFKMQTKQETKNKKRMKEKEY